MMRAPHLPDGTVLLQLLSDLTDDKLEIFCRLFELPGGKRRDERIDVFLSSIYPRILASNPNASTFLHFFVGQMRSTPEVLAKIRDPPLPIVFVKLRGCRPSFRFFPLNAAGFDLTTVLKERRPEVSLIGSWFVLGGSPPNTPIYLDRAETPAVSFGGSDAFYLLSPEGTAPPKIQINFRTQPSSYLTWFVIQPVEKKPTADLLKELAPVLPRATEATLFAKTPYCKGCLFVVADVITEICKTGIGRCPTCGGPVTLSELIYEVKTPVEVAPPPPASGEDEELHKARLSLADHLASFVKLSVNDNMWADSMFEKAAGWDQEPRLMEYHGSDEFLALMRNMS
jgi:hypothetical protein